MSKVATDSFKPEMPSAIKFRNASRLLVFATRQVFSMHKGIMHGGRLQLEEKVVLEQGDRPGQLDREVRSSITIEVSKDQCCSVALLVAQFACRT